MAKAHQQISTQIGCRGQAANRSNQPGTRVAQSRAPHERLSSCGSTDHVFYPGPVISAASQLPRRDCWPVGDRTIFARLKGQSRQRVGTSGDNLPTASAQAVGDSDRSARGCPERYGLLSAEGSRDLASLLAPPGASADRYLPYVSWNCHGWSTCSTNPSILQAMGPTAGRSGRSRGPL